MDLKSAATLVVALTLTVGCGGDKAPTLPQAAPSTESLSPSATPSPTPTPTETETESPTPEPTFTEEPPVESSGPAVLASNASGRTLTLADVFSAEGAWEESRYDVANRRDISGIGATLDGCGESSAAELELRLARNFKRLSMSVGQANNSPSSDDIIVVSIVANGRQNDTRRIPFDRIQPFSVNVTDVNALKLRFWIEYADCTGHDVVAVVENLTLFG